MAEILLFIVVVMMLPKIISGIKEGIKFVGRAIGWGIAGFIILYLIKIFFI